MFPTNFTFHYNQENFQGFAYIFDINSPGSLLTIILVVSIYACIYLLAPHIYSFMLARKKKHEKETKRNVINDLIIMRDIQGELEKEIEQSLINISLNGNKA